MTRSAAALRAVDPLESRGRRAYTEAFRAEVVDLVRRGQSISQVSREKGVARNTIKAWVDDAAPGSTGLVAAAASGDRKRYLEALRDEIAKAIEGGMAARDLPPNARLLNDTLRELEEIAELEEQKAREASDAAGAADEPWDPEAV